MTLINGIPAIGFGTSDRTGEDDMRAILAALEIGYRHLDTAQTYGSEGHCGEALRRSGLKPSEVFVTTKITGDNCRGGKLIGSLKRSCDTMGLDRVDLALIHWPVSPRGELPMEIYLPELAEAQQQGLARLIGISNFTIADTEMAISILGPDRIVTNQVERHPLLRNQKLVDYSVAHGIAITCYLPLARGHCAGVPVIEAIARDHDATPHQIALAMSLAEGHIVIPTSRHRTRIEENFAARLIKLSPAELERLRTADRGERQINPSWSPVWDRD
jgi:2,5-diketo-D-gluconate reductase B